MTEKVRMQFLNIHVYLGNEDKSFGYSQNYVWSGEHDLKPPLAAPPQ